MTQPIQTLKGFRDFLPQEKRARDYVAGKIKATFELFGFEPIETPTLEYASLLLGKYGEEADKLVYTFEDRGGRNVGLRYDQTVPSARILAQYQNQLPKYFRRYNIQNVFRADKPQAGRYREFTQCDADIFGSNSPLSDAEILVLYYQIFNRLGIDSIKLKVNDRSTLMLEVKPFTSEKISLFSIIQSLDKLDKLSQQDVEIELCRKGMDDLSAHALLTNVQKVKIAESLAQIVDKAISLGLPSENVVFTPTLARGLDYYTGMIFEGVIAEYSFGSVGGGGRYDNLIGDLSGISIPAVGFGLGFDRTVEAAVKLNVIPELTSTAKVFATIFNQATETETLKTVAKLRSLGISTELCANLDKMDKQLKLASQKKIAYVVIIGPDEASKGVVTLKNMATGEQQTDTLENLIPTLS
jgi:histidyl-tRNA synthetase